MKIIHEREKCIGCGTCASLCPQFWQMGKDGKSHLKGAKQNPATSNYELEIEKIGCNKEVITACPVQIIHIIQ